MTDPKERARNAVSCAIRKGTLTRQSCEECGAGPTPSDRKSATNLTDVVAHHDDYSKPLDVRWLCRSCHAAHHRAMGSYVNNGRRAS